MGGLENGEKKKLRVLCLHGYCQDKEAFRRKTGSLRKVAKKFADFVFIDAPHLVEGGGRGWYLPNEIGASSEIAFEDDSAGSRSWSCGVDRSTLEASLQSIENVCKEGNFDGVLGFSQGSAIIPHLLARKGDLFRFACLFSGFESACTSDAERSSIFTCPSFHCYGSTDTVIAKYRSVSLANERFRGGATVEHSGGHLVPSKKDVRDAFVAFLKAQRETATSNTFIRRAVPDDCSAIHSMVVELAVYEKEPPSRVRLSAEQMKLDLLANYWHGWVVVDSAGGYLGFALCHFTYSTWEGRCLYLEDLFVRPKARKRGHGVSLIRRCVREALNLGCSRLCWQALDWNAPAVGFYTRVVGAKERSGDDGTKWLNFIMEKGEMEAFVVS